MMAMAVTEESNVETASHWDVLFFWGFFSNFQNIYNPIAVNLTNDGSDSLFRLPYVTFRAHLAFSAQLCSPYIYCIV